MRGAQPNTRVHMQKAQPQEQLLTYEFSAEKRHGHAQKGAGCFAM